MNSEVSDHLTQELAIFWNLYSISLKCLDILASMVRDDTPNRANSDPKVAGKSGNMDTSSKKEGSKGEKLGLSITSGMNSKDVYFAQLATLCNRIFQFFKEKPINFTQLNSGVVNERYELSVATKDDLINACTIFLASHQKISQADFSEIQKSLWDQSLELIRKIESKSQQSSVGELDEILKVYERLLDVAPKYHMQTATMSDTNRFQVSNEQLISFLEKMISRNPVYANQRASMKEQDLDSTVELILKIAQGRMQNQRSPITPRMQEKIKYGAMDAIIDIQSKGELQGQVYNI
jgi:hypothetical protein